MRLNLSSNTTEETKSINTLSNGVDIEYLTLPHIFQAEPSGIRVESEWNGRNGRNLVGMTCQ